MVDFDGPKYLCVTLPELGYHELTVAQSVAIGALGSKVTLWIGEPAQGGFMELRVYDENSALIVPGSQHFIGRTGSRHRMRSGRICWFHMRGADGWTFIFETES